MFRRLATKFRIKVYGSSMSTGKLSEIIGSKCYKGLFLLEAVYGNQIVG